MDSGKELTDFYTTTMKDAGYALESSNDGLEIDGYDVFIQLLFKKEDKTLEVNISEENSLRIQYLRQSRRLVDCVAVH